MLNIDTTETAGQKTSRWAASAPPRVVVVGTGYLGATHAAAMAALGMPTVGVDTDQEKIARLTAGKVPFFEPELEELLQAGLSSGLLRFTTDLTDACADADAAFVCVGTPQARGSNSADLRFVESAVRDLARCAAGDLVIVGKSTVPVGTAERLRVLIAEEAARPALDRIELIWNPEFLREGMAVQDTLHPDRIVIGGASADAETLLRRIYQAPVEAGTPFLTCDLATAELVKVSANAFLATKISFINAIADVCQLAGADVRALADAIGYDVRIGRQFLNAGLGFGGGCLPKDIRALMHRAAELGSSSTVALLQSVDEINMRQRQRVIDMALDACDGSVLNRRIAVLGAAFKPLTDDVRDSPALNVAAALHLRGAQVTVFDPQAAEAARRQFPTLHYVASAAEAVQDSDLTLVLTEWDEFVKADPVALARDVAQPVIIDARVCLDAVAWRRAGWTVNVLGDATAAADRMGTAERTGTAERRSAA